MPGRKMPGCCDTHAHSAAGGPARACAGGADLQVTITGLAPEASAAAIDSRLGGT